MKAIIGIFICLLVSSCGGNNISISDTKEFDVYEFVEYTEDYNNDMFNEGSALEHKYIKWESKKVNSLKIGDQITLYGFYDDEKIIVVRNIEFIKDSGLGDHTEYSTSTNETIFAMTNGDLYLEYTINWIEYSLTVVNHIYGMVLQAHQGLPIIDVIPPLGRNVNEIENN